MTVAGPKSADNPLADSWRELVDTDRLAAWMADQGLGSGPIEQPVSLGGGTQNLLLAFTHGGRRYILRRPPLHPRMDGNATMRREMRALAALADTDVPHPRLLASCPDVEPLGAAFYLMEPIDGFNASMAMPQPHAGDPAMRHAMGLALIDGAVKLGRVDPVAAGLADLGRADGFLERQVARWKSQLEGYGEYAGWAGPQLLPGVDRVADWLEWHRPSGFTPGIMHGDYHLGNVMFRYDGPELAAIVDWELVTIGDPLLDLGWILATWPEPGDEGTALPVKPWAGFPTSDELIAHYAKGSARDLAALPWYRVLACYKLGILLEGSNARACAGKAPREIGDRLHASAVQLFSRAARLVDIN